MKLEDLEYFKIFCATNRTRHDAQRAVENGSFAVEANDWDEFIKQEGWLDYPTFCDLLRDESLFNEFDLEWVKYKGKKYILVIVH